MLSVAATSGPKWQNLSPMFSCTRPLTFCTINSAMICRLLVGLTFKLCVRIRHRAVMNAMTIHVLTTASERTNQSF